MVIRKEKHHNFWTKQLTEKWGLISLFVEILDDSTGLPHLNIIMWLLRNWLCERGAEEQGGKENDGGEDWDNCNKITIKKYSGNFH